MQTANYGGGSKSVATVLLSPHTYKTLKSEASRHSNPAKDENWQWKSKDCDFKFDSELHDKEKRVADKGEKGCAAKS